MQNTGRHAPIPYYQFGHPAESLSIIQQYLPDDPVIVEAGAYDGNESCILAQTWPKGHVHSFEPINELFQILSNRVKNAANISTYKLALGDHCGQTVMYLSSESNNPGHVSMSSSLYSPKDHLLYAATLFEGYEVVDVITLDEWAEQKKIDKVDMLWLDMQGYELPALKAAPKLLSNVSVILTELEFVEAYEGQPLYQEVKLWLEEQGFVLIGGNFGFPKQLRQWFGDGLFVRRELVNANS